MRRPWSARRRRSTGLAAAAATLLLALVPLSCTSLTDQCAVTATECADAHTLRLCVGNHDAIGERYHWQTEACADRGGAYCVVPKGGKAMCALEASTNPKCDPDKVSSFCTDQGLVFCNSGYAAQLQQCPGQCITSSSDQSCALCDDGTVVEDPSCVGNLVTCSGGVPGECRCGYRVRALPPCAQGTTCIVLPGKTDALVCALSTSPDPKCDAYYQDGYCDGSVVVHCLYGYETQREDCAPKAGCVDAGSATYCH